MESPLTIAAAARQVGRSPAAVRTWIRDGTLELVGSSPQTVEPTRIAELRRQHLGLFDGVVDVELARTVSENDAEPELMKLRATLRAVLASIEAFDAGVAQLRAGQRIAFDALLGDLGDLDVPLSLVNSRRGAVSVAEDDHVRPTIWPAAIDNGPEQSRVQGPN